MSYFDDNEDDIIYGRRRRHADPEPKQARCNTCGSTDVRWRQQGGRWVLFSLTPGVVHQCAPDDLSDDFDIVE